MEKNNNIFIYVDKDKHTVKLFNYLKKNYKLDKDIVIFDNKKIFLGEYGEYFPSNTVFIVSNENKRCAKDFCKFIKDVDKCMSLETRNLFKFINKKTIFKTILYLIIKNSKNG